MDVSSINQYIGKLAVITGASAGIGAALTTNLARRGINVVGLARRIEKVQELAKENTKGKIYAIKCDITNEQDVIRAFQEIEKLGPIHILINNAGKIANTTLYNGNVDEWKKVLDVNVIGTCLLSREVVRTMTENNVAGQIININSILGHFKYDTPLNIYPASKFALTSLTETLRLELIGIDSKIKLTSLSPGPVEDTEFFIKERASVENGGFLKYFLKPEDIVNAVFYILSTPPHMHVAELMLRPVGEKF